MRILLCLLCLTLFFGCAAQSTPAQLIEGNADPAALAQADDLPLCLTILDNGHSTEAAKPDILAECWNGKQMNSIDYWHYLYRKYDGASEIPPVISSDAELIFDFGPYMPKTVTARLDPITYASPGYICGETPQNPAEIPYTVNYTLDESGNAIETISLSLVNPGAKVIYLILDCSWSGGNHVKIMTAFTIQ